MKIAYIHQYFNTPAMSGGTRSHEIAARLVRKGHHVSVITTWRDQTSERNWMTTSEDGIDIHWLRVPYSNHLTYRARLKAFCIFALRAAVKAASLDVDVVFATSTPLTVAVPGVYCSRRKRIPFVFEVRDLWPEIPIKLNAIRNPMAICAARLLETIAYRSARHIVALSPDMRDGILRVFPRAPVTVIPNFCHDADAVVPPASDFMRRVIGDATRPVVLYAGTIGLVNNLPYMVAMARAARDMGHQIAYVVVGDGREAASVRRLAGEQNVYGSTFFMAPPVPKREMKGLLAAASIATSFVLPEPALWANSANKVFDAMAAGRPIAINHGGWLSEVIARSGAGLVLPSDDPGAAATMVYELLADETRLKATRAAARELASSEFNPEILVDTLENILIKCISHQDSAHTPVI